MLSLNPYKHYHYSQSPFQNLLVAAPATRSNYKVLPVSRGKNKFVVRSIQGEEQNKQQQQQQQQQQNETRRNFLTLEEAGLIEMSGLSTHERFLCRLTVSSLNLLRVISEQEGCTIEELNVGKICDWFMKDKLKREQNLGSAVLQWDDSHMQF